MDIKLFFLTLFLGWFGIDKFYVGGKAAWKFAVIKFLTTCILVGILWNIFDLVKIACRKYELDFRNYFL